MEEKWELKQKKNTPKAKKVAQQVFHVESSDEETNVVEYADHSSDDSFDFEEDHLEKNLAICDYIIVNVYVKSCVRKYLAIVDGVDRTDCEVRYLKRNIPSNRFSFTTESAAELSLKDMVAVLPEPIKETRSTYFLLLPS